jgi:hypothetical protein
VVWGDALTTAVVTNCVVANCVVFVPAVAVGAVGVPVSAGEAKGALSPIAVAVVVAKLASSPRARASSSSVFKVAGAESTRFATAVPTKAVVAMAVELFPAVCVVAIVPVGRVGVPVKVGEARSALRAMSPEVTGVAHAVS